MQTSNVVIPHGMTPARLRGTCGTRAPNVPSVSRRGGCRTQPRTLLVKRFWPTCGKTRRLLPLPARLGLSGTGLW